MKRLTPLLTLLSGAVTAAVLLTMSAQASPPATQPAADNGPPVAAAPAPTEADPDADTVDEEQPDPAEASSAGTEVSAVEQNWIGKLENAALLAITAKAGKAEAYVCDGRSIEMWLSGTVRDGKIELSGEDAELTGVIRGDSASGEMVVGVRRWKFTARPNDDAAVKSGTGVAPAIYRATDESRRAGYDGGWVFLPDGTQIVGIVTFKGKLIAAPPLDPAFHSTLVDGFTITTEPVIPGAR